MRRDGFSARERLARIMASVTLDDLAVSLGGRTVLDRIGLSIPDGEFVAVVGPSGVGKSTLLRAIAGLVPVERGAVLFGGVDVTRTRVADRDIGMVFQTPVLLPRRNVRRNVQFPLELRRDAAEEIHDRVMAEARALQIEHLLRRRPDTLSRGEEQLVQIARTMVRTPQVLLLDEPFAPLDHRLRRRMRTEIKMLQAGYGVTTIMATNDPVDATTLPSMLVVLGRAGITQVGTPGLVHDDPVDLDVASATGPTWTLPVRVESDGEGFWLVHDGAVRLRSWLPALDAHVGSTVTLAVRSEGLARHDRGEATALLERIVPGTAGSLMCRWGPSSITVPGTADPRERGKRIRLRVERPLFFDVATGQRIA